MTAKATWIRFTFWAVVLRSFEQVKMTVKRLSIRRFPGTVNQAVASIEVR